MQIVCLLFYLLLGFSVHAQLKKDFYFQISDNTGIAYVWNDYLVTADSLIISGDSDFGRSRISYLTRSLTRAEKKMLNAFFSKYDFSRLDDRYWNEPNQEQLSDPVHTYRIIKAEGRYGHHVFRTSMHNCYAEKIAQLISLMNRLVPAEVRINLNKDDFHVIFP
jgi:hypothetical protein